MQAYSELPCAGWYFIAGCFILRWVVPCDSQRHRTIPCLYAIPAHSALYRNGLLRCPCPRKSLYSAQGCSRLGFYSIPGDKPPPLLVVGRM
ncbi:hypothetical protein F5Y12DRAFT_684927 [Xylaria sp. FL1777]|nr:hypothetical protein F5Y12DRAFT_684927 [Xylaria sp. FL1777]